MANQLIGFCPQSSIENNVKFFVVISLNLMLQYLLNVIQMEGGVYNILKLFIRQFYHTLAKNSKNANCNII